MDDPLIHDCHVEVMHGRTILEMLSNNQTQQPMSCLPYQKDKFNESTEKAMYLLFSATCPTEITLTEKHRTPIPMSFRLLHSFQMLRLQMLQVKTLVFEIVNKLIGFGLQPAANNTVESVCNFAHVELMN